MKYSSTNVDELQALVEAVNTTVAIGGDCPELGMTGILNALNLSNPHSNVMVLTDAAAKDVNRTKEVILAAKELRNAIHFFISTPFCDNVTEYLEVANATNGIVVNTITDFEAFAQFADNAAIFNLDSTLADTPSPRRKKQTDEVCIQFITNYNIFTTSIDLLIMAHGSIINITTPGEVESLNISGLIGSYSDNPSLASMKCVLTWQTFNMPYQLLLPSTFLRSILKKEHTAPNHQLMVKPKLLVHNYSI